MRLASRILCAGLIVAGSTVAGFAEELPTTPQTPQAPVAQPTQAPVADASPYSSDLGTASLSTFDSSVGYIEDALPANMVRLRFDAAWHSNRSARAEFFYARGGPGSPGLPTAETLDNYQELSVHVEGKIRDDLSVFIDAPWRWIDPQIDQNHEGFGDMSLGFKWAFLQEHDSVTSLFVQLTVPTGDAHDGLGTAHTSIEPGLLFYRKLSDYITLEGEVRDWIPLGGTSFAGDVFRYGIGFSYGKTSCDDFWFKPVVEVVGWTVLSGKETVVPPVDAPTVKNAAGDTIVNAKFGARVGFGDRFDIYTGYGRALTGAVWYKDIWRTEIRWAF